MNAWLRKILDIALLRSGPQDLPAALPALLLAIAMWWLLTSAMLVLAPEDNRLPLGDALVTFALQLLAVGLVLSIAQRSARFNQTAQALFATGALIGLLNLPLWLVAATPVPGPLVGLALVGLFWSLSVDGHVWRHALELSYPGGLAVAVLVFLLQIAALEAIGLGG